ncbi:hypothetical protein I4U23_013581 [Adineta vaga]|nr:hypothetical protein I4U23_013581 [Adineta vaga]
MVETSTKASPSTLDTIFSVVHQLFDQYRVAVFVLTGTLIVGWLYNKLWVNRQFYPSTQTMQGKTILITGGNTGIGYEAAKDLLQRGARVIIVCRNMERGHRAIRQLRSETNCNEKNLRLMECDLCSLDSVRKFAKVYNEKEDRLDVLICNAGLAWSSNVVTKDGFNSIIQANYLGHFLLTQLLLDKLKKCRPSRIINISSGAHKSIRSIDWSDAFTQFKSSRLWGAYPASKGFQILSTYKLKRDLLAKDGINTFSINPGWVWTSIQSPMREALGLFGFLIAYPILRLLKIAFAKTPETGSRTTIYCAVEPSLEKSQELYFESCKAVQPTSLCTDDATANRLWKLNGQNVPYNGICNFTHDCTNWHDGRVVCDDKNRCTCRKPYSNDPGRVFWDDTGHRCVYCPFRWFQRESRCYYFDYIKSTWSGARSRCQTNLADLIVFRSPNDLDWIRFIELFRTNESRIYDRTMEKIIVDIGAMNKPFAEFGEFSWINNTSFTFDQNSSMWCRPNINGVPSYHVPRPSWTQNSSNETRISLVRWSSTLLSARPVYCLNDEKPDEYLAGACEITVTDRDLVRCDCTETPYSGTYCTEKCGILSSHCLNGGNCTKPDSCTCTSLWRGSICEIAKNPCLPNPCQHNTKCLQLGNTPNFICDCEDSGWTGKFCHLTSYPCPAERCKNNGQCKPSGRDNFTCNCLKTGYQGAFCENGCLSSGKPCQHSGSCIENECFCNPSTAGDFCEILLDRNIASSQKKTTTISVNLWLIIILSTVGVILIIGLLYSRRKMLKSRQKQTDSIDHDSKSILTEIYSMDVNDNDSVSVTSTQVSQMTANIQE